jgi:6-phosphogluconolactonase
MTREVRVLPDANAVAWEAAARLTAAARRAVQARGRFTLALSGGATPLRLFALLGMGEWLVRAPWEQTHIFWADERCVPPDHPDSNYGAARAALLLRLPTPAEQIHRWYGEAPDPEAEARRYADVLRRHSDRAADGMPRLDYILLGMGTDGHTASLFPHTAALRVADAPTAANYVPQLAATRLTLTFPALNAARAVLFLVTGAEKAHTLARVLEGPAQPDELPAQGVQPRDGTLTWLVDAAAAAQLRER